MTSLEHFRDALARLRSARKAEAEARLAEVDAIQALLEAAMLPEPHPDEFISLRELAERTGYAPQTLRNLVAQGTHRAGEH